MEHGVEGEVYKSGLFYILVEWPSGLRLCNQNWKVQTPLSAPPSLLTQSLSDLQVKNVKTQ